MFAHDTPRILVQMCTLTGTEVPCEGYTAAVNKEKPDTANTRSGARGADDDVVSDPAKSDDTTGDWSDEGGATPSGQADTGDHTQ